MKAAIQSGLRPQDVLVLLKVVAAENRQWRQQDLANELGLSQAEVANSLERLRRAGLVEESKRKAYRLAAIEFIVHGVKYFYPPEIGSFARGVPTGHSAKPLKGKLVIEENLEWVWPDSEGQQRGLSLSPIYASVPFAAKRDKVLHELLALIDSIRAGGSREKKMAEEELKKRLLRRKSESESEHEIQS